MTVDITLEASTVHTQIEEITATVVGHLRSTVSSLADTAGLPDFRVTIRITDTFVEEIESNRKPDSPPYTTERIGGTTAAIVLAAGESDSDSTVLVNSAAFVGKDPWALAHLPSTLGHEMGHSLISKCRRVFGAPQGYHATPGNPVEALGFTALSVHDEFLADELAKTLVPPINVTCSSDGGQQTTVDRAVIALNHLIGMTDAIDEHIYPLLGDCVHQYRITGGGLDEMIATLASGVHGGLILSAHFRSSSSGLGSDFEGMPQIEEHPANLLYLKPFWSLVGPVLDKRVVDGPLYRFVESDQRTFDVTCQAVEDLWRTLGITFELLSDGQVFVHVDAPAGW